MKLKHTQLLTTRIIMAGFAAGVIIGTILLSLPIAQKESISLLDAFFVATSSVCVTGLSTVNIGATFSWFGQIVLLLLIEVGGLGVITFTVVVMLLFGKKLSLTDRMLIQNAYNMDSMTGLIKMTWKIMKASMIIQGVGAVLYCFVFIPDYGIKGLWFSLFHSVSAFCNAGIDLLGGNSFTQYRDNVILNVTTMALVVVGGIGFPVYWEVIRLLSKSKERYVKKLSLGAKIALISSGILILGGAIITLIYEWSNPATLGNLSMGQKIMSSLFQSVTLRTAGFATIDQAGFTSASSLIYIFMMLIGGSPAGTAGGIKTVTLVVIFATMVANIKGSENVNIFNRRIEDEYIKSCCAIASFSIFSLLFLTSILMHVQNTDFLDVAYEMTSAVATVGLSRGMTGDLNALAKVIVCLTMYLGRIGPITIALSFGYKNLSETRYAGSKLTL